MAHLRRTATVNNGVCLKEVRKSLWYPVIGVANSASVKTSVLYEHRMNCICH